MSSLLLSDTDFKVENDVINLNDSGDSGGGDFISRRGK